MLFKVLFMVHCLVLNTRLCMHSHFNAALRHRQCKPVYQLLCLCRNCHIREGANSFRDYHHAQLWFLTDASFICDSQRYFHYNV
jgi:hypothetical protein